MVLYKSYEDTSIKPLTFKVPKTKNSKTPIYSFEDYANEKEQIKEIHKKEVNFVKEERKSLAETQEDKKLEREVEETLNLNEAETRKKLIDIMLRDAGWDVNNTEFVKVEFPLDNHKEDGKKGFVDYVLLNKKGNPVAVVEAKKNISRSNNETVSQAS